MTHLIDVFLLDKKSKNVGGILLQHFPINLSFWGFDVLNYCFDVSIKKHQDSTPLLPLFLRHEADQEGGGAKKFQGGIG